MTRPEGDLEVSTPGDREITITRDFDAPRALVWDAMTTPELLRRWLYLPPGWTMTRCEDVALVGGAFHWEWRSPDGSPITLRGVYREVVRPERLVRTESFDAGGTTPPDDQVATLVLTERDGRTRLTLGVLYPNRAARDATLASGMTRGMSAGYANLDALLAARTD